MTPPVTVAQAVKDGWFEDAARLRVGLLKRPVPGVPHMNLTKHPEYAPVVHELAMFAGWLTWFSHDKPGAASLWRPGRKKWAWKVYGEYAKKHPRPTPSPDPKPGPERVSRWKNPPWRGIGLHVAWGFNSGQWTPEQLATRIAGTKVQWSALEDIPADNTAWMTRYRNALHDHGKPFGIWWRADVAQSNQAPDVAYTLSMIERYSPDFLGADIEAFPIYDQSLPHKVAEAYPDLPRVVIIAGMPDAPFLTDWWDSGWDCMTEAYSANIGKQPVPGIAGPCDHDAYWRGCPRNSLPAPKGWGTEWWQHGTGPHTVPIIECRGEGNPGLAAQMDSDAVKWFQGSYSIWLAEQLTDDDWALLAGS